MRAPASARSVVRLLGLAALLAGLVACSSGTEDPVALERIEVAPVPAAVAAGRMLQFSATARFSDGSARDVSALADWASSMPAVATVDDQGLVSAAKQGASNIVASFDGLSGSSSLQVGPPAPETLAVTPANPAIADGATQAFHATLAYSDGSTADVTASANWSSSDTSVATVGNSSGDKGVATAQQPGTATIAASYPGVSEPGSATLSVVPSVLFGGGETVAALAYVGSSWYPERRLSRAPASPPDANSLFARYTSVNAAQPLGTHVDLSYCQTGNTFGTTVFTGPDHADGACGDYSVLPGGFSAQRTDPDFAAADLPVTLAEWDSVHIYRRSRGYPVQVPALVASVAIPYNNSDAATADLNLTTQKLCDIFSGKTTDWHQLDASYASKAITVVYRSDRSAATFALSNRLTKLCSYNSYKLRTEALYADMVRDVSAPPALTKAANGNAEAARLVAATDGAIGYGEAADTHLRQPSLALAKVDGQDALENLADLTINDLPGNTDANDHILISGLISGSSTTGRPLIATHKQANPNYAVKHSQCLFLVKPDVYANPIDASGNPGYPIVGISYLRAYTAGNGTAQSAIKSLLLAPYDSNVRSQTQTVGPGTGFAFINGYNPGTSVPDPDADAQAATPACSDDRDNDGDGTKDYVHQGQVTTGNDLACTSLADTSEFMNVTDCIGQ